MKKKSLIVCLAMTAMLAFAACGGKEEPTLSENKQVSTFGDATATEAPVPTEAPTEAPEATATPVPTEAPAATATPIPTEAPVATEAPTTDDETPTVGVPDNTGEEPAVSEMIQRSLMQTGNNYRLKKAIEKARNGEEVVIAYVGGSITEGANAKPQNTKCYAYRSYEYFKETFANGGDNVKFVNAGLSGTPSTVGLARYDKDVVAKVGEPDIVFVEFAVNDGDDPTKGVCFESLVLNALQSEKDPAVVLVFSVFKSKWNLQSTLAPVGTHYDLPMISIKDAVLPALASGELTEAEFFSDIYHPTTEGHQLMADCINYMFDVVDAEPASLEDITIPGTPKIGNKFVGFKVLDSTTAGVVAGGFNAKDNALSGPSFKDNWMKKSTEANDSLKATVTCKNAILYYKSSSSATYGKADVYVDGNKVATLNGYAAGGWNNPQLKILFDEATAKEHTIEVKMADGDEGKAFTILAIGYTE